MAKCASAESYCKKQPVYAMGGYTQSLQTVNSLLYAMLSKQKL